MIDKLTNTVSSGKTAENEVVIFRILNLEGYKRTAFFSAFTFTVASQHGNLADISSVVLDEASLFWNRVYQMSNDEKFPSVSCCGGHCTLWLAIEVV